MPTLRSGHAGSTYIRQDFVASIVVFLVALPLCMGIAIASGAPPAAGLITGIIGGLIVGPIAGSPLQVSGPAAGLAVIVWQILQTHGYERLGIIVLLAGLLQLVAGIARLGQWFRAVAPSVIQGMLAGIGILIFASQFHVMVDDAPKGSGLQNLMTIPSAIYKGLVPNDGSTHQHAAMIGLLTIILMTPRKLKWFPAPLVAVVLATLANYLLGWDINRIELPSNLLSAVRLPTPGDLALLLDPAVVVSAITIAAVASAETLLCANAVDQLHTGPRTRYDRELSAQGIGNALCGLVGALPMTGVIVRSGANVEAGGKTRLSATLHGVWLLIFVALLPQLLALIPKACLAAILVYTGYRLVNIGAIRKLAAYGKSEVLIYAVTVITIVAVDLLTGVLVGIGLSVLKLVYTFSHLHVRLEPGSDEKTSTLHIDGAATFLRLPRLAAVLERVPADTELHVRFENLSYIDHACLQLLIDWERQHEATGGRLVLDWENLHARFAPPVTQINDRTARLETQIAEAPELAHA